jgi:adenylate cyclase
MLDVVPGGGGVLLGILAVAGLTFVGQEGERQILKRTFDRYVSPGLLEGILQDAGKLRLGGELRLATVVFVDIRGFTSWTQTMDPRELVDELNEFLTEMVEVIFAHEGSVNKFMGDAVLAIFGAPLQQPDDASHAVAAAGDMQRRLRIHNQQREARGKEALRMGIGIATGPVVAGNVGSSQRLEYTVIGNAVNLSARLQALSRDDQVLADAATVWALREQDAPVEIESIGQHELKGMHSAIEVFQISSRQQP